jgi:hypothetical protein
MARMLFAPTTLPRTIDKLEFVQAAPIRAPAPAQDLTLLDRIKDYRAGDLKHRYAFQSRHPAAANAEPDASTLRTHGMGRTRWQAQAVSDFVRERVDATARRPAVPRDGAHRRARGWCASVRSGPHHRAPRRPAAAHGLLGQCRDRSYAPLPERTLKHLVGRLVFAAPQWLHLRKATLARFRARLQHAKVGGHSWYWPTASRSTRLHAIACLATTHCRCCGATRSSAEATSRGVTPSSRPISATWAASRRATPRSSAPSTANCIAGGPSCKVYRRRFSR